MSNFRELTTPEKKRAFLRLTQMGVGRTKAAEEATVTLQAVQYWRRQDEEFRRQDDRIKLARVEIQPEANKDMPSFEEFCKKYLDTQMFNHHHQWLDVLEGREPRNLHPSQQYIKGEPEFLLINTPPEHAKSTTITTNYVTYRICEDPNIRIIIVSQTQEMAKKFLRGIKDRLASNNTNYRKLQIDFAPDGGFDANAASWTADSIYVSSDLRDSGEKDPTVQALSIGGHIYGSRADLIILDDCVTGKNAHEYQKQMDWLQREVYNRLSYPGGRILLVGTRLAPTDLYGEIIKDEYYGEENSPWTYLTQPAVLEFADDPKDWTTLWPYTNRPPVSLVGRNLVQKNENGLYPMWTGPALKKRRASMSPRNWALVYQQERVVDDAIFNQKAVMGCIDGGRQPGPMNGDTVNGRPRGTEGCYIVGGFDPAMTGDSAAVVIALDRMTGCRWVLEVWAKGHCKPDDLFDKIKEWTVKYKMNEWRIEKNAMNLMVTQNREIRSFLASRGCLLKEHFTGSNKWDADFGVASMSMLFDGWESKKNLIRLPNKTSEGMRALIEQLTTWEPDQPGQRTKRKTDTVMALWFAEIRCRELVEEVSAVEYHVKNPWASERDKRKQMTVDLDYMAQSAMHGDSTMEWWSN
jgi:hypothetical protein